MKKQPMKNRWLVLLVATVMAALGLVVAGSAGTANAKVTSVEGNCMKGIHPTATVDVDPITLLPTGTITVTWTDNCTNLTNNGSYNIEVSNDGGLSWSTVTTGLQTYRLLAPPEQQGSYTIPADFAYPCGSLIFRVIAVHSPGNADEKTSISSNSNAVDSPAGDCGGGTSGGDCEQGTDALTLGFYSNKNGMATETQSDFDALNALNLRNADGSSRDFSGTLAQERTALSKWLLNATATNMSYMLSAQLATLELNILHLLVDAGAIICGTEGQFDGQTVQQLFDSANSYLGSYSVVKGGDAQRSLGDALETLIDEINNNLVAFE